MASNGVEFPVFADTSLGTHIAISVSPNLTVANFKRKLEREHIYCFPKVGEIRVNKLMVKRNSCFYILPESLRMRYAFQGVKGTRFIYIKACVCSSFAKRSLSDLTSQQIGSQILNNVCDPLNLVCCAPNTSKKNVRHRRKGRIPRSHCVKLKALVMEVFRAAHHRKKKKKGKRINRIGVVGHLVNRLEDGHFQSKQGSTVKQSIDVVSVTNTSEYEEESNTCSVVEVPGKTLAVSDIINKYFSEYEEITSTSEVNFSEAAQKSSELLKAVGDSSSNLHICNTSKYIPTTPQRATGYSFLNRSRSLVSMNKHKENGVGKRLLLASNKLGVFACKQKTESSVCRLRQKKLSQQNSTSLIKRLVFEISDKDD